MRYSIKDEVRDCSAYVKYLTHCPNPLTYDIQVWCSSANGIGRILIWKRKGLLNIDNMTTEHFELNCMEMIRFSFDISPTETLITLQKFYQL